MCRTQPDGEPFEEKMQRPRKLQAEAARLDAAVAKNLEELGNGE